MKNIGLSFTSNTKKLQDGLAKYTNILTNNLRERFKIIPYCFGRNEIDNKCEINIKDPYTLFALKNFFFNKKIDFKNKVDLIHVTDNRFIFQNELPVITTVHDIIPIEYMNWNRSILQRNNFFKKIYLDGILSSNYIISISNYTKNKIVKLGYDENKISVIHHGIDEKNFFLNINKNKNIDEIISDKQVILCVGTIQPRKNIFRYIKSFRNLDNSLKSNSILIIVGKKGWQCKKEISILEKISRSENIVWFNNLPDKDLNYLYTRSKILLYASLEEGFGMPILDAFVSSTAVITSNISCLPEIAEKAAYYVNPYSTKELTMAIRNLLTSSNELNSYVELGHKRLMNFKLDKMILKTEKVYKKLV